MQMLAEVADPAIVDGARLGSRAVLLAMPTEAAAQRVSGRTLPPPYGVVAVSGQGGPHAIVALAHAQPEPPPAPFSLLGAWSPVASTRSGADLSAMADMLDTASQHRLLEFLLGFCRTAFRLSADAGFAASCARLARRCARDAGPATPLAAAAPGSVVLGGVQADCDATLYLIGPRTGVRHSRLAAAGQDSRLQMVETPAEGDLLLAMGRGAALWTVRAMPAGLPGANLPGLASLPPEAARACRAACVAALRRAPQGSPEAALRREWSLAVPAAPRSLADPAQPVGGSLELAVQAGAAGLFLRGWLRDPAELVAAMELVGPGGCVRLPPEALHRVCRPDVQERYAAGSHRGADARPGFVGFLADPRLAGAVQPTLRLRLRSGASAELVPALQTLPPDGARNSVLASVDPAEVTDAMMRDCIAPAAAALHRSAQDRPCAVDTVRFGRPVARPRVSLAIPLYRQLGFLRFQLAALAADPDCAAAEILFVLDSPEQRDEAEHLLRGLHLLHAVPLTLLLPERNLGFAGATNLAAARARAPALLLLNSDVIPAAPGWLSAMLGALGRAAAVGPKLLFEDDSIQHAGLFFQRDPDGIWLNQHFHKGMPRRWPAACRARAVPGVTGAALLVDRARFEAVGGVCTDYIIGDYEDSDLCLRLRQAGGAIGYVPQAELYHFERRSIALHPGYTRTLACRYNRMLHHARWDGAMAEAMRAPRRRA